MTARAIASSGAFAFLIAFALGSGVTQVLRAEESASSSCTAGASDGGAEPAEALVRGGTVAIGSARHYPEERAPKRVSVRDFRMDTTEVTNGAFARFVAATGYITTAERASPNAPTAAVFIAGEGWRLDPDASWRHPDGAGSSIGGRDDDPVVQVSFEDALAYARWRGRALPSEAQWEYAAREGIGEREFGWPGALVPGGTHRANTWQGAFPLVDDGADGHRGRAPVGCFVANGFGLHDMIGNVWEWTASPYYPTHQPGRALLAHSEGFDPRQPGVSVGVIKGGSWLCSPDFCRRYRPAARHAQDTGLSTNHIGFRTVLNVAE